MSVKERLKEIEQRLNDATPGPYREGKSWFAIVSDHQVSGITGSDDVEHYGGHLICESVALQNRPLLAHSWQDIKFLLELLKCQCPRCKNVEIDITDKFCKICGLPIVDYRFGKIGDSEYKVCNKCDAVGLSNFECPNCRRAMRRGAGEYMNSILDAIDKRQEINTK